MGHVEMVGWVMQGWGGSCRDEVGWVIWGGVGHAGVGWVRPG